MHPLRHAPTAVACSALVVLAVMSLLATIGGRPAIGQRVEAAALGIAVPATDTVAVIRATIAAAPAPIRTKDVPAPPIAAPTSSAQPTPRRAAPTHPPAARAADTSAAGQVLRLVNTQRLQAGCRPVTLDARLTAAAAGHSLDMATHDYASHDSQDGATFVDRIEATGYPEPRAENIAAGQPTPTAAVSAWMASPDHRANILDCAITQMGVASARGGHFGTYWTQDFGSA